MVSTFDFGLQDLVFEKASVAQLDSHPTGGQEVDGLTPVGSATVFRGD